MEIIKEQSSATIKPGKYLHAARQLELEKVLKTVQQEGVLCIILDFSEVETIDKQVLYSILIFKKRFKEFGGEVLIKNVVNPQVKRIFEKIHLAKVIQVKYEEKKGE